MSTLSLAPQSRASAATVEPSLTAQSHEDEKHWPWLINDNGLSVARVDCVSSSSTSDRYPVKDATRMTEFERTFPVDPSVI